MKVLVGSGGALGLGIAGLVATVQARWDRPMEAPVSGLVASTDPEIIERGRYLAMGPAHCAGCHGAVEQLDAYERDGVEVPLTGGFEMKIPPATLRPPNITPDTETGIGEHTDEELVRALRYGIAKDGRMLFPIMPFADLADDDLVAIISYLRSLDPVEAEREPTEIYFLGRALFTFVVGPSQPTTTPKQSIPPSRTAEYGEYLAKQVANCYGCHTNRDLATGEFTGEPFAGGLELEHRGRTFVIPNITPDGEGSRIQGWDEAGFIARVRQGEPSAPGSPMPWRPFASMSDDDLAAIFAYLQTVPSVDADTGPSVVGG